MKRLPVIAAAIMFSSNLAYAAPTTWELLNDGMDVMGTFLLDIGNQTTSAALLSGDLGFYTVSSRTYVNSTNFVGPYTVNNYMNFFSTDSGKVFRSDYGGGEYSEIRVNESAIEIGTPGGVLAPGGGLYAVYINEIFNFDETNVYCSYYEEIYDPDTGEYIGEGGCAFYDSYTNYNTESGYWYGGYLRSLPATAAVPLPPSGWLVLLGLAGMAVNRRSGVRR